MQAREPHRQSESAAVGMPDQTGVATNARNVLQLVLHPANELDVRTGQPQLHRRLRQAGNVDTMHLDIKDRLRRLCTQYTGAHWPLADGHHGLSGFSASRTHRRTAAAASLRHVATCRSDEHDENSDG